MSPFLQRLPRRIFSLDDRKSIGKAVLILLICLGLWFFRSELLTIIAQLGNREALIQQIGQYGPLGAIILVIVLILQVIIAALPGHLLIITGGYLFGFTGGFLLTHTSVVFSSQICYWLARKYGRPVVEQLAPAEGLGKWTRRANHQGITFFIFSFNLPFFPADVMNYVAGLSGISAGKYFIANILGKLPTSILFTLIGSHGFELSWQFWIAAAIMTIVIVRTWQVIGNKLENRLFETDEVSSL